jgi:hypothetical protein
LLRLFYVSDLDCPFKPTGTGGEGGAPPDLGNAGAPGDFEAAGFRGAF